MSRRSTLITAVLTAIGLVALVVGAVVDPRPAGAAWLVAWSTAADVAVGALIWVCIAHVAPMRWFAALRPSASALATTIVVLAPGVVPVLVAVDASASTVVRTVIWLVIVILPALALAWFADRTDEAALVHQQRIGVVGLIAVGFGWTFATYDWILAGEGGWTSPIYAMTVIAHAQTAGLAAIVLAAHAQARAGRVPPLSPDVDHALGRLLLTALLFQAYVIYDQLMLMWITDLPDEVTWWIPRLHGTWGVVGGVLLVAGFAVPLALLLSRDWKRSARGMQLLAGWMLIVEIVETAYRLLPSRRPGLITVWDPLAVLGVGGALVLAAGFVLGRVAAPADALLAPTLEYRSR